MKAILEIDMPECCAKCPLFFQDDAFDNCIITDEDMDRSAVSTRRGDKCPLIPKEGE